MRELIKFLNSRYLSFGLRMSIAVTVPSLVFLYYDRLFLGIIASLGALCVGVTDIPGTFTNKRNGILIACLVAGAVSYLTAFCSGSQAATFILIAFLCLLLPMLSVYGTRASNIGTAGLLAMVFALQKTFTPAEAAWHALTILGGGVWYAFLTLTLWQIRPYLSIRQSLADIITQIAGYIRVKAAFYAENTDTDQNFRKLLDIQTAISERQEEVRELLLKRRSAIQGSNSMSRSLMMVFIEANDIFEQAMASMSDYRMLHERFDVTGVLKDYQSVILHVAGEMENIADSVLTGEPSGPVYPLHEEIGALRKKVDALKPVHLNRQSMDGFIALKNICRNVEAIAYKIRGLHAYSNPESQETAQASYGNVEPARFTTRQRYDLKILRNNLTLDSIHLRHALRVSIATTAGFLIAQLLGWSHSYWILLTVVVIMKPGFGMTKERTIHRTLGTVLGAGLGLVLIYFVGNDTLLFVIMLLCIFLTFTLIHVNYRLAVVTLTPFVLLLFHFIDPENYGIILERIVDTGIGGGLAFIVGYLLLPSWEYMQIRSCLIETVQANARYFRQVARRYAGGEFSEQEYKLARKEVNISSANLSAAFGRMLTEPKSKQKNASSVHQFVVLNHLLSSHIATLSTCYPEYALHNPAYPEFDLILKKGTALLDNTVLRLQGKGQAGGPEPADPAGAELPVRRLGEKLEELTRKRLEEVELDQQDTATQRELSLFKAVHDGFGNILNICAELDKLSVNLKI